MLAEFCPAMYDLPTQGTIKKSKFPASSDQLFCKSMSMHSLSAKRAIVTAALNRSFPVYLLSTCLSSKERDLAILLQNGCFQCKRGEEKSQFWVFTMFAPFPSRDVFWVPGDKKCGLNKQNLKKEHHFHYVVNLNYKQMFSLWRLSSFQGILWASFVAWEKRSVVNREQGPVFSGFLYPSVSYIMRFVRRTARHPEQICWIKERSGDRKLVARWLAAAAWRVWAEGDSAFLPRLNLAF